MKKTNTPQEDPLYHDTWTLLRKYRDVVWSLELSVRRAQKKFEVEYGKSIEDFLDSIYLAGVDFKENGIEQHAQSIERSYQMLQLVDSAVALLRSKHKHGETYYWILYYSFLSPQEYKNAEEIINLLRTHITDIAHTQINYSAAGNCFYKRAVTICPDYGAAAAGNSPLRIGCPLTAVLKRCAELFFSTAEITAGCTQNTACCAAAYYYSAERKAFCHG